MNAHASGAREGLIHINMANEVYPYDFSLGWYKEDEHVSVTYSDWVDLLCNWWPLQASGLRKHTTLVGLERTE